MVFFEITKFKSYQASCEVKYFSVTAYELGAHKYGKWFPNARRTSKGHFNAGTLLQASQAQLDGCVKLFRRPETRLSDLKAYLRTKGSVIMSKKQRIGIRSNCSSGKKREALALKGTLL